MALQRFADPDFRELRAIALERAHLRMSHLRKQLEDSLKVTQFSSFKLRCDRHELYYILSDLYADQTLHGAATAT